MMRMKDTAKNNFRVFSKVLQSPRRVIVGHGFLKKDINDILRFQKRKLLKVNCGKS